MTILEMSTGGALLIAVILVLRRVALYRLPKWSFLLLWMVALCRLLIPFSVPSQFSIYTGVAWIAQVMEKEKTPPEPAEVQIPEALSPVNVPENSQKDIESPASVPVNPALEKETVAPLTAVYLTGGALCGLFFAIVYVIGMRRFSKAKPLMYSDFIDQWQKNHPALIPITIKICDTISSPMACGLLKPTILLPENTDWSDEDQLTCILTHEYVHIRRGDLGWKLLLAGALCLHWFNPLVWLMYFRANQDLELACDERVVQILGLDKRKGYACSLLAAAESGFPLLCITYTTKNHMEERIKAIMKMKKKSTAVILCTAILVAGISAVFVTSPKPRNIEKLPVAATSSVLPNPSVSVPVEKDVFVPDTFAVVDLAPAPVETENSNPGSRIQPVTDQPAEMNTPESTSVDADTPHIDNHIHPVTDEPAEPVVTAFEPQESAAPALENRWDVPDGEIPQLTEFVVDSFEDAHELGKYLEATHGLYPGDYVSGCIDGTRYIVQITYQEKAVRERLPDGIYPVNNKGETYGTATDSIVAGYDPDLILVQATNGKSGYVVDHDLMYGGYPGEINTPDDAMTYMEWRKTQPAIILIPVYDVNRDTIIGYFGLGNGSDR